jgi:YHS domain-containing protein
MRRTLVMLGMLVLVSALPAGENKAVPPRDALQPFNLLVGTWRGAGTPDGTAEEKQKGHWQEAIAVEWKFQGSDVRIEWKISEGKHLRLGELRWDSTAEVFRFRRIDPKDEGPEFTGKLVNKVLTLERIDPKTRETQRIIFSLLHANRFLYRWETKPADRTYFTRIWQVGATKEGVPFAETGRSERECVVSGGNGTTAVTFNGKTYYVCCSGCRDEFRENPEKYVREFEAKRAKK